MTLREARKYAAMIGLKIRVFTWHCGNGRLISGKGYSQQDVVTRLSTWERMRIARDGEYVTHRVEQ